MVGKHAFTLLVLSLLVMGHAVGAHAADVCQPVFDAWIKVATTPSHSYTTSTGINGGKPMETETIFSNGQKYIRVRGKWMRIPVTSQDVIDEEKEKEHQGKSTCQLLRTESVNGETAMLYSIQRDYEDTKESGRMWISRSTGLLLRAEFDIDSPGNKIKEHRSSRFEYSNIQPPM